MKPRYTLNAGRLIERDGAPFATIHGAGQYDPVELDQFARDVATMATYFERTRRALAYLAVKQCVCLDPRRRECDYCAAAELLAEIAAFDPYAP